MKKASRSTCYYCFAPISKNNREDDHFPIPADCGGTYTVPLCRTCHDLKDRYPLEDWPVELSQELNRELAALKSRVLRIFLAKALAITHRNRKEMGWRPAEEAAP